MGDTTTERSVADTLAAEQEALGGVLHALRPEQWDEPSLCPAWTIRDVVRHLAFHIHREGLRQTLGSSEKYEGLLAERAHADTIEGLVAWFESPVPASAATSEVNLAELVIHGQDVRRAVGVAHTFPDDLLVRVLDQCTTFSGNLFVVGRRRRLGRGLELVATDVAWTKGSGPRVSGPGEALLMALAGRSAALADLDGAGVEVLDRRHESEQAM